MRLPSLQKMDWAFSAPFYIGLFFTFAVVGEGDAASALSNEVTQLKKILETDSAVYLVSNAPADPIFAQKICEAHSAKLVSFQSAVEFRALSKKLQGVDESIGDWWTSGISFSNSTIGNYFIWSSTGEPFTYNEFHEVSEGGSSGAMKSSDKIARNRRSNSVRNEDCNCDCSTTPAPPTTHPPCKIPRCNVTLPEEPICQHITTPHCTIDEPPECNVDDRKCTVHCEPCKIVRQPVCTIKDPNQQRCRLEVPKCEPGPPDCRITERGKCWAIQDNCTEEQTDPCKPIIKPCKNSCADSECTTVTPGPCVTTPSPCETTIVCPPNTVPSPSCKIEERCRNEESGVTVCETIHICPNNLTPYPPACTPETKCAPPTVTCPQPVSHCTRPFVDCSPEICQSNVHLCLPPNVKCPGVRIQCEPDKVECDVKCSTEPEVICEIPDIECTKPKIVCPDAHVQCDPLFSTCEHAKLNCTQPTVDPTDCKKPTITCGEPTTCPIGEIPNPGSGCGGCNGSNRCSPNRLRESNGNVNPSEVEVFEQTLCVAMKSELDFKWILQSCNLQHRYVCERMKKKGSFWKGFMDSMVIG